MVDREQDLPLEDLAGRFPTIGKHLIAAKKLAGHGNWQSWLKQEFAWSESAALKFMQVGKAEKHINFTDLNVPISSVYQLAAPSTPDTVREAVVKKAAKGKVKHKEVLETVRDTKPKSEAKSNGAANAAKHAPQTKPESTLGHPAERAERVRTCCG